MSAAVYHALDVVGEIRDTFLGWARVRGWIGDYFDWRWDAAIVREDSCVARVHELDIDFEIERVCCQS